MKLRTKAAAAALGALSLIGLSTPAMAQYPGTNGAVIEDSDNGGYTGLSCLHDEANYGDWYLAAGEGALSPSKTREAGIFYTGDDTQARLGVAARTADGVCSPAKFIATVDSGSGLSFSPDSKSLAVVQHGDIYVIDAATGAVIRNLTPNLLSTSETDPTWDPTGKVIAYVASDGIRTRPYTGGASRLLIKGAVSAPDYSPDGTKIAYLDSTRHITIASASTGALIKKTPIVAQDYNFYWSPDGKQFAFGGNNTTCVTATLAGTITSRSTNDGYCIVYGWAKK